MTDKEKRKKEVLVEGRPVYPESREGADEENEADSFQIHNGVISVIARLAATKVPGVVEISGNIVDGIAGIVGKKSSDRGVHVEIVDNSAVLELSVVVEYGVSIPKVVWQIQHDVREAVEQMTGKAVKAVNVIVKGVQVPRESAAAETKAAE